MSSVQFCGAPLFPQGSPRVCATDFRLHTPPNTTLPFIRAAQEVLWLTEYIQRYTVPEWKLKSNHHIINSQKVLKFKLKIDQVFHEV